MRSIRDQAPVLDQIVSVIVNKNIVFDSFTMHQSARIVADTIGTAYSGVATEPFQTSIKSITELFGAGNHKIIGSDYTSSLTGAIFYSALAISSTDYDEGHRKAVGHPASMVVPVALLLGNHLESSRSEILKAVIIGYEIATRFSNARVKEKITSYSSGRWGAIGAAATASYLLGLTAEQTINALSNAAILSPTMIGGTTDVSTGSMSKEGVAWAVQSGLQSTLFSMNGFVGPYLFVDDHDDYKQEILLEGLGKPWLINSNYFKPYSCCRWLHGAIAALLVVKKENDIKSDEIDSIEINIFERAIGLIGNSYPENNVQAQFHLPYCIAIAFLYSEVTPKYFTSKYIYDAEIHKLIDKIDLIVDKGYTKMFPGKLPSLVKVNTTCERQFTKEMISAPWDADNPPSDELLFQKFISQTGEKGIKVWNQLFD